MATSSHANTRSRRHRSGSRTRPAKSSQVRSSAGQRALRQHQPQVQLRTQHGAQRQPDEQRPRQLIVCRTGRTRRAGSGRVAEIEVRLEARRLDLPVAAALQPSLGRAMDLRAGAALVAPAAAERAQVLGLDHHQVPGAAQDQIDLGLRPAAIDISQHLRQALQP